MSRPFIRGSVAIDSMRDNGFLSAAHALAEIIDNSVQANANRIELIAFEKIVETSKGKTSKRIDKIGVLDNGKGMSVETLHLALEFGASENRQDKEGIGKFGMGLPNSSISQCKRLDVWSWTSDGVYYHTYLDIDEIKAGELETIPKPRKRDLPKEAIGVFGDSLPKSGTFVLWSKIDRCQWKTGKSIYKHTQDIVGRMYRRFLQDDQLSIRFKSTVLKDALYVVADDHKFLANDPTYLMKNTSLPNLPGPYNGESMFELFADCEFPIKIPDENGEVHDVKITGSVLKKSVLEEIRKKEKGFVGASVWGKHAAKNVGLSVLRSGREIALLPEFLKKEEKSRFYSIQIEFEPALDNIFGVTNNKQHVVNLRPIKESDDYEREGFDGQQEYIAELQSNNDLKLRIYEIARHIREVEQKLSARINTYNLRGTAGSLSLSEEVGQSLGSVEKLNVIDEKREENYPTEQSSNTKEEIEEVLTNIGADNAKQKAKTILDNKLNVWVEEIPMATSAFFEVSTKRGLTLLQINSNHVFTTEILQNVPEDTREALEICLGGWARMERECTSDRKLEQLQRARKEWGQLLEDYLEII